VSDQLDSTAVQVDSSCSVQEAAARLGLSEKTIRRRIKAGTLSAFQRPTSQGFEWRVQLDSVSDHLDGQPVQVPPQVTVHVDSTEDPSPAAATEPGLLKALDIVDRLQRENLELAGQVGFLQAKLQVAEQRILLLEATPADELQVEPESGAGHDVQATEQLQPPVTKPWWRRLFNRA
jgi:excisionase family DNA binding protein